jgi:acetylglutamate kinase
MLTNFRQLRAAAPYVEAHRGQLFVLKAGGELLVPGPGLDQLLEQLALLHRLGIRLVLVHGGGPQIAALC